MTPPTFDTVLAALAFLIGGFSVLLFVVTVVEWWDARPPIRPSIYLPPRTASAKLIPSAWVAKALRRSK